MAQLDIKLFKLHLPERAILKQRFVAGAFVQEAFDFAVQQMNDRKDEKGENREAGERHNCLSGQMPTWMGKEIVPAEEKRGCDNHQAGPCARYERDEQNGHEKS